MGLSLVAVQDGENLGWVDMMGAAPRMVPLDRAVSLATNPAW